MQALGFLMVRVPCMAIRREELPSDCGRIEAHRSVHTGDLVLGTCFGIRDVLVGDNLAGKG